MSPSTSTSPSSATTTTTKLSPWSPHSYAAHPLPSLSEWQDLWLHWDTVTRSMIPSAELLAQPIRLRNACIFYLGHIPTFLDIKLAEVTDGKRTEPASFARIFERGIDPDVDDPAQCHAHSEIPDTWPAVEEVLAYQERVRARLRALYDDEGKAGDEEFGVPRNRRVSRAVWLGFEHELMHLETLLYMLVQSDKTLPPPTSIAATPDFAALAAEARKTAVGNTWFEIPAQKVHLGLHDPEEEDLSSSGPPPNFFGWDVEKPVVAVDVPAFRAQARPITNGEYAAYLLATATTGKSTDIQLPASWVAKDLANGINGFADLSGPADVDSAELSAFVRGKAVRTVYGKIPLALALDWPVAASYDELNGCAAYLGGRIPTMEEARSLYEHAERLRRRGSDEKTLARTIPAVNGHLVHDGVRESPPAHSSPNGCGEGPPAVNGASSPDPGTLHVDLADANVGFKHWHPMPVTPHGDRLAGHAEMGGLWEWTSSTLTRREGFKPGVLYPAFSGECSFVFLLPL